MKRRQHREIMVFSISFLDVIASALGAILILFIIQYKKTVIAQTEITQSEERHVQCTKVLEWMYQTRQVVSNEVVVTNKTNDTVQNTPFEKRGTATKPNSPNNNVVKPVKKVVKPVMKVNPVDGTTRMKHNKKSKIPVKTPVMNAMNEKTTLKKDVVMGISPMDAGEVNSNSKSVIGKKINTPHGVSKVKPKNEKKKSPDKSLKKQPAKTKKIIKLPPKPKRRALATCLTSRESVVVSFYDYDEPDGDTIMVTFNGRHATKLKLRKKPQKKFRFHLTKEKYNIISIKNLSNGFYPVNTANVYISGCGRARWKMKSLGVTRVIYIYRK